MGRHNTKSNVYEDQLWGRDKVAPFESAEEAWFWFIAAQEALNDGARFVSGAGVVKRPCEPVDILKVIDRLYRSRRLVRDHLLVLRHYGRRHMAPDYTRAKEKRAYFIWNEALERMAPILERKGIIEPSCWVDHYQRADVLPQYDDQAGSALC